MRRPKHKSTEQFPIPIPKLEFAAFIAITATRISAGLSEKAVAPQILIDEASFTSG